MKYTYIALTVALILASQIAAANPTGAQVVQGSASFSSPNANVLNITNSHNAIIQWQQFNIGAGQTTNFHQPSAASAVLNRVTGNNPSHILGNLNSNGQVFVINQHGLLVGEGAHINTAGFFGSTLNITDADFLNGKLKFAGGGLGGINNHGYIHASEDGNVVLIAPNIENGGVIEVDNGNIILAAGESITITNLQNSAIEYQVSSPENSITNLGQIIANQGAASLFAGSLKHSGSIRATGLVQDADGTIRLVASDLNEVSGEVDVSGQQGGRIEILGDVVDVQQGAVVDASGEQGGGEILIGGDQQGLNPDVQNAQSTTIAAGAQVHADATDKGDGGKVIVFAENDVHVHGEVTAKGGVNAGDGGFIETSGLRELDITSVPDASATNGEVGEWLIDPNNIDIVAGVGNIGINAATPFLSTTDAAQLGVDLITAALDAGTSVTITTGIGAPNLEAGDINVNTAIITNVSVFPSPLLTLNAHNDINVNADISATFFGMDLTLNSDSDASGAGQINFGNTAINVGGLVTLDGNSFVNGALTLLTRSDSWVLNAPMTVTASGSVTTGNFISTSFTGSTIINNGTMNFDSNCGLGDDCGAPSISSAVVNNNLINTTGALQIDGDFQNFGNVDTSVGSVSFPTGIVLGLGTFTSNPGSTITGVLDAGFTILSQGTFDVLAPTVLSPGMLLSLEEGKILNAQNLTIPDTFSWAGGTISGNGVFITPPTSTTTIRGSNSSVNVTTMQGDSPTTPLDWINEGSILWNGINPFPDITLTNAKIFNDGEFYITLSFGAQISGTNSQIVNGVGAAMGIGTSSGATFNVPFENHGVLNIDLISDQLTLSNDLTLENGALLMGEGTLNLSFGSGTLTINNGGGISPGRNDDGTLTINGNLVVNPGAQLMFDLESTTVASLADRIQVNTGGVTINGGDLHILWEGPAGATGFNNIADGTPLNFIDCFFSITACMTINSPLTVHDPLNTTGSSVLLTTPVTGQNTLQFTLGTKSGSIFEWSGGATGDWNVLSNWLFGGSTAALLPDTADSVLIDGNGALVQVNFSTTPANVGDLQSDALMNFSPTGSLNVNGQALVTSTYVTGTPPSGLIFAGAGATLGGIGVITTLPGTYQTFDTGAAMTINTWDQMGVFSKEGASSLIFNGTTFNNIGAFEIEPTSTGDVQLLTTGAFNNNGLIISEADVSVALTSHGVDGKISVDQGTFSLGQDLTSDGQMSIASGAIFSLDAGTNLLMNNGGFFGFGEVLIPAASSISFNPGAGLFDPAMILTLNGGTINNAQNLGIPDTFLIGGGTINGLTTPFITPSTSTTTYSGAGNLTVNTDWNSAGLFTTSSSVGDLILNGVFSNSGTMNLSQLSTLSDINGTGTLQNLNILNANAGIETTINTLLDNGGSFNVSGGTVLTLRNATAHGGILDIGVGSLVTLNSTNSIFTLAGTPAISGSGVFSIETGTQFNVDVPLAMASTLTLDLQNGGTINNAQNLGIPDTFLIGGGTINGLTTPFITPSTSTTTYSGAGNLTVNTDWNSAGLFTTSSSVGDLILNGVFSNSGTMNLSQLSTLSDINGTGTLQNLNILNANAGIETTINTLLDNGGSFNVSGGTVLTLRNATAHGGILDIAAGSSVTLSTINSIFSVVGSVPAPAINGNGVFSIETGTQFNVDVPLAMASTLTLDLQNGGTINNAQNLGIPDTFLIGGGTINGITAFNTPLSSITTFSGAGNLTVNTDWNSAGLFTTSSSVGDLILNGVFSNSGTMNLSQLSTLSDINGTGTLQNLNILNANAGIETTINTLLDNGGSFNVSGGTVLTLRNATAHGGILDIAAGSSVTLSTINSIFSVVGSVPAPAINGNGVFSIETGTQFNVDVPLAMASTLTLDLQNGGTINNAQNLGIPDTFLIGGGTINGITAFNTPLSSITTFNGAGNLTVNTDWNSAGLFTTSSSVGDLILNGVFSNSGTMNLSQLSTLSDINGTGTLQNLNILNANAGIETTINTLLDNGGSFNVSGGTVLTLRNATAHGGILNIGVGSLVTLNSINSVFSLVGTPNITGNGVFSIETGTQFNVDVPLAMASTLTLDLQNGGTINNAQNLGIPDTFLIGGGTINGLTTPFITPSTSTTTYSGAGNLTVNTDWNSAGLFTTSSSVGDLILNGVFSNSGTMNLSQLSTLSDINGTGTLQNLNILNANAGIETTINTLLDNGGSFNVSGGTVLTLRNATAHGGILNIGVGSLVTLNSINSVFSLVGTPNITGSGLFSIESGTQFNVDVPLAMASTLILDLQNGGTINNAQNLGIPDTFLIGGGTINGITAFNTPLSSITTFNGAGNLTVNTDWISNGIFTFASSSGDLDIQSTFSFTNAGTFNMVQTNAGANVVGVGDFINTNNLFSAAPVASIISANFINSAGTIDIFSGSLSLGGAALTLGGGTLKGSGTFIGDVVADSGSLIAPGLVGPGALTISGNVDFQAGSIFNVEVQSATPGDFDELLVSGNASIADGALLNVIAFGGYTGGIGDSLPILTAAGSVSSSAVFSIATTAADFSVTPTYVTGPPGSLTLDVTGLINFWIGGTGSWLDISNWSRGIVPDAGHDVFISGGPFAVTYSDTAGSTINALFTDPTITLDLTSGSILNIAGSSNFAGTVNMDNATLGLGGPVVGTVINMVNSSSINGTGTLNVLNSLSMGNSQLNGLAGVTAPQYFITGTSRFVNTVVNHDDVLSITGATDRLVLGSGTQLVSTDGTSSSASIVGAGALELAPGSDWQILTASQLSMAIASTLDMNGGLLTNSEKLFDSVNPAPGVVNVFAPNFVQNAAMIIPSSMTFNYFDSSDIVLPFDVSNEGTFNLDSAAASINMESTAAAVFTNLGSFNVQSVTDVNVLIPFNLVGGAIDLTSTSALIVQSTGRLDLLGGGFSGSGATLGINGGTLDASTPTTIPVGYTLELTGGTINNAQNLTVAGDLTWAGGEINGTRSGTDPRFTTRGTVELTSGTLNADWLIADSGIVNWGGSNLDELIVNGATITNEGQFNVSSFAVIPPGSALKATAARDFSASTGASFVNAGILRINAALDPIVFDLNFVNDGGTVAILSGSFSLGGADLVLDQSTDSLQGFGTFEGNVINTAGIVTPGINDGAASIFETGALTIDGNFTQSATGSLVFDLDSTLSGLLHDSLTVSGQLNAGGRVAFNIINGRSVVEIAALLDTSFKPLSFGSRVGQFDTVFVPPELNFEFSNTGVVTITSTNTDLIRISNELEVLFEKEGLSYGDMVESMKFADRKVRLALSEEEDEEEERRAPRLVCK